MIGNERLRDPHQRAHARGQMRDVFLELRRASPRSAARCAGSPSRTTGSIGRIFAGWSHATVVPATRRRAYAVMRQQLSDRARTRLPRTESRTDTCRSRIPAAASDTPRAAFRRHLPGSACGELRMRSRNGVMPGCQRGGEHRLDVAVDLRLVEFAEHVAREALDAEAEHAKSRAPHRREALVRHGIDAVGADELQLRAECAPRCFAATIASHSGRMRRSRVKVKMSS